LDQEVQLIEIKQNNAFITPVILVSNSDGYTPTTGVTSGTVTLQYRKEGATVLSGYNFAATAWNELGQGLYDVTWTSGFSDTVGSFVFVAAVSGSVSYYGQREVVKEKLVDVYNEISGAPAVHTAASYDGATLGLSFGLERQGEPMTSPVSGEYHLYNQIGSALASGISSSPDSQGVFRLTTNLTLTDDTVPYVHASVKDATGRVTTRQYLPVVK
jgi:hypothetical protein